MNEMDYREIKFKKKPCEDAIKWLETQPDFETAWNVCERGDWMWWVLRHLEGALPTKELSVEFADWCASNVARAAAYAAYAADAADAAELLDQAIWIRDHVKCPKG